MPKKAEKVDDTLQEGDRAPGEENPSMDDSHIVRDLSMESLEGSITETPKEPIKEPETTLVDVQIGGRIYQLPPEAAEAYNSDIQERDRVYREAVAPSSTMQPTPVLEESDSYADLMFSDPNAAVDRIKKEMRSEFTQSYTQDQAIQKFWQDFYLENPALHEDEGIVKMIMTQNWSILQNMVGKAARDHLARLTETEILRIVNNNKSNTGNRERSLSTTLEGPSKEDLQVSDVLVQDELVSPMGIGEAIKARRLARHRARNTAV